MVARKMMSSLTRVAYELTKNSSSHALVVFFCELNSGDLRRVPVLGERTCGRWWVRQLSRVRRYVWMTPCFSHQESLLALPPLRFGRAIAVVDVGLRQFDPHQLPREPIPLRALAEDRLPPLCTPSQRHLPRPDAT